ncbi:MAG: aminotransferase class I/II-fold pyridoxal phosphate-dependent enzyme [Acidobacteriota bacterium]|jgi:aspartate/methionine/tyrosine aminotransferase
MLSHARFNLATSGVVSYPLRELGVSLEDIELSGPSFYGYEPLQQALAAKTGAATESVVAAIGTSFANHLAMAVILEPGDEVLIEQPAYEPLLSVARYLGARVSRFQRRFENGFAIDPEDVNRNVTPRTKLIVITNLHNPSSVITGAATLKQVGDIARRVGARVLVDEVYLETVFAQAPRLALRSAFHLGNEFIVTSSLTKAYGLSGLRCGWILAEPELAKKIWRLHDLFEVIPAHSAERLSVVALKRLVNIAVRARALLEVNRPLVDRFLSSRADLDYVRPEFGTVVFPRLKNAKVDQLCTLLREKYETTVVPGRFFEMPDHFRLGIGGETEMLAMGLERLAAALDIVGKT